MAISSKFLCEPNRWGNPPRYHQHPHRAQQPSQNWFCGNKCCQCCQEEERPRPQKPSRPRRFRVAWLAEPPYLAQQQAQVVGCAFEGVHFADVDLSPHPAPPPSSSFANVGESSFAAFTAPAVELPPFLSSHPPPVGAEGGLVFLWFVDPVPALLPPFGNVGAHAPFSQIGQQPVVVIALVHDGFLNLLWTARQHQIGFGQT